MTAAERLITDMVRVPSLHGTLAQNDVQDVVRSALTADAVIDDWVPDWSALREWTSPLDGRAHYVRLEDDPRYRHVLPKLRCVAATLGAGHPHLVINSHVDVVTTVPEEKWTGGPFRPRVEDTRLYARGAMDAKGGLAAAVLAFGELARRGLPRGRVTLLSVPEEETGGNGTLAALHRGHVGDGVVFAESTDLQVVHRHIGLQLFSVRISGRPGGILRRSWGDSAVTALGRVLTALHELELTRTARARLTGGYDADDLPGFVNPGTVAGGEWLATRAAHGEVHGVMGLLPGETQAEAEEELRAAVTRVCRDIPWFAANPPAVVVPSPGQRGGELPETHRLVQSMLAGAHGSRGPDLAPGLPAVRPSRAGTMVCDAKTVQGGGFAPSVVFGPVGGNLHAPDEWVDLLSVERCAQVLVDGALAFLRSPVPAGREAS